jgi:oligopeptide transport system ATP-binding protein
LSAPLDEDEEVEQPVLEVRDLAVEFHTKVGVVHALAGVGYSVWPRETLAVVGESGSGKSVTAQTVMGLLDPRIAHVTAGEVLYKGVDLLTLKERERRRLRGSRISLIPQDAMAALNPVMPVGRQIAEMFEVHRDMDRKAATDEAVRLMERVGIASAQRRRKDLPHQFSGGMRQRLAIAVSVAVSPEILIADEATSALDVTMQLQIVQILNELKAELRMSLVFITHDLLAVKDIADRVAVMYAGRVVETGLVEEVFENPTHPYTEALLLSTPRLDGSARRLRPIPGRPPGLVRVHAGCPFAPRCSFRHAICDVETPPLRDVLPGRRSACHFAPDFHQAHVEASA